MNHYTGNDVTAAGTSGQRSPWVTRICLQAPPVFQLATKYHTIVCSCYAEPEYV